MTLNGHFALNSVLRRYVWSSEACMDFEAWLALKLIVNVVGEDLNGKEQLRHRAVSLQLHGFLVLDCLDITVSLI